MWEQAKARANEIGSMVLWCDGGDGGVSGIAGQGINEITQVGQGSWVRRIGVQYPFDERRTVYAWIENSGWLILALALVSIGPLNPMPFVTIAHPDIPGVIRRLRAKWRSARENRERQPLLGLMD
jgi:hypothetical protein